MKPKVYEMGFRITSSNQGTSDAKHFNDLQRGLGRLHELQRMLAEQRLIHEQSLYLSAKDPKDWTEEERKWWKKHFPDPVICPKCGSQYCCSLDG